MGYIGLRDTVGFPRDSEQAGLRDTVGFSRDSEQAGLWDTLWLSRDSGLPWPAGHCGLVTVQWSALAYGTLWGCHGTSSCLGLRDTTELSRDSEQAGLRDAI